jgi:hydrogenase expression/formation protein HypC
MCLAIPGKVVEIQHNSEPLMGKVSFGGIVKQVCLDWVPEVTVGEYVIVHVGFAISKVNQEEAIETIKMILSMEGGAEELNRGEQPVSHPAE